MKQRTILLSTGNSDPSLGAGTVHFWVESLSLSNWGDWSYVNKKLGSEDLNHVWSVYLLNEGYAGVRIVARED
jgi:hypothetical protein